MTPSQVLVTQHEFRVSMVLQWAGAAAPALIGMLLIACRGRIASVIGPDEGWPLILGRVLIIACVGVVMSLMLEQVFKRAVMVVIYEIEMSTPLPWFDGQFWFQIIRASIPLLPLGVLWLLMRRMTTSSKRPAAERAK